MSRSIQSRLMRGTGPQRSRRMGGLDPGSIRAQAHEAVALVRPYPGRRLGPAAELQLVEDTVDVVLHRGDLDAQLACDLLVGQPTVDEVDNLELPVGQARPRGH